MSMSHEAGVVHAAGYGSTAIVPGWLRPPDDVNSLLPQLWSRTVSRGDDGVLRVGGVPVTDLAAEFGTPAYVLDEADFRSRAAEFRNSFTSAFAAAAGAQVYYASKAFICTQVAGWIRDEGLGIDVCSGGELAVALAASFPPDRITMHGNNKSDAEIRRCLEAGIGRLVIDSAEEVTRIADAAAQLGVRARVLVRVTVGVEAHTHEYMATAHEDQKFGVPLADGQAAAVASAAITNPHLEFVGLHSHIGSQIFDTHGFEVAARRLLRLHADLSRAHSIVIGELCLGGGYGIAYTSQHDPMPVAQFATSLATIVAEECARAEVPMPRVDVEPGRAIVGPAMFTLYEVGAIKDVQLDGGASRRYVSVDGGMSDNIRTALYDADYSCALASRASNEPGVLSRVVGKHCESGDIVVRDEFLPGDVRRGDLLAVPGTGAYGRSMASQYNHITRPPVIAVREGQARVVVRRETEADLLGLDVP